MQVDVVGPQRFQRVFQLQEHILGLARFRAIERLVKLVTELAGHDPLVALAFDRLSNKRFRRVVAIALGGVDQVDAKVAAAFEHRVDFRLLKRLVPFAAELPGSDSDNGHV